MKRLLKQEFGKRLKAARRAVHLTQSRLGELIGAENVTVSRWESGVFTPDEKYFDRLCSVLNKPPEYFTGNKAAIPATVEDLTEVIKRQEDRINALEAQLSQAKPHTAPALVNKGGQEQGTQPSHAPGPAEQLLRVFTALDDSKRMFLLESAKRLAAADADAVKPGARSGGKKSGHGNGEL